MRNIYFKKTTEVKVIKYTDSLDTMVEVRNYRRGAVVYIVGFYLNLENDLYTFYLTEEEKDIVFLDIPEENILLLPTPEESRYTPPDCCSKRIEEGL